LTRRELLLGCATAVVAAAVVHPFSGPPDAKGSYPVSRTEREWLVRLSPEQFWILRKQGTEPAWTSSLLHEARKGTFSCVGCANPLFSSATKYDSGTGWPSFWDYLPGAVMTQQDKGMFGERVEVHCARCGGHLGHVFEDGPPPTYLRYCMNGAVLSFAAG
jgi:peptide-methionine (R)-S-oxide reductase